MWCDRGGLEKNTQRSIHRTLQEGKCGKGADMAPSIKIRVEVLTEAATSTASLGRDGARQPPSLGWKEERHSSVLAVVMKLNVKLTQLDFWGTHWRLFS